MNQKSDSLSSSPKLKTKGVGRGNMRLPMCESKLKCFHEARRRRNTTGLPKNKEKQWRRTKTIMKICQERWRTRRTKKAKRDRGGRSSPSSPSTPLLAGNIVGGRERGEGSEKMEGCEVEGETKKRRSWGSVTTIFAATVSVAGVAWGGGGDWRWRGRRRDRKSVV